MSIEKEKIWKARNISLSEYFIKKGFKVIKYSRERFKVKGYGGLYLHNCTYYWFSKNRGGNSIDCLMDFFHLSFEEAVEELLGSEALEFNPPTENFYQNYKSSFDKNKALNSISKSDFRAVSYLEKTRCINPNIVAFFKKNNLFWQDLNANLVFPLTSISSNGELVGIECIGTSARRWKHIEQAVDLAAFVFKWTEAEEFKSIIIFEATIDLMSFLSLKIANNYKESLFVSMLGLKPSIIDYYIEHYPTATIFLAVDNDKYGENLVSQYPSTKRLFPSSYKDWNELLKEVVKK